MLERQRRRGEVVSDTSNTTIIFDLPLLVALAQFQALFADPRTARLLAADLFVHGRAVAEIRRTHDGKIVGLDPIDATTIHRVEIVFGPDPEARHPIYCSAFTGEYEQRIVGRDPIRIPAVDLLVITRES